MTSVTPVRSPASFGTTHWSLVASAGSLEDETVRAALETLCADYWLPLYCYVRRRGHSAEDSQDLTQEFFARLVQQNWIAKADRSKGRFRSFLLLVLKRFLANEWDKSKTLKKGGNIHFVSLSEMAESKYTLTAANTSAPDLQFERDWAFALLDRVLCRLEEDYSKDGKGDLFAAIKHHLSGAEEQLPLSLIHI